MNKNIQNCWWVLTAVQCCWTNVGMGLVMLPAKFSERAEESRCRWLYASWRCSFLTHCGGSHLETLAPLVEISHWYLQLYIQWCVARLAFVAGCSTYRLCWREIVFLLRGGGGCASRQLGTVESAVSVCGFCHTKLFSVLFVRRDFPWIQFV